MMCLRCGYLYENRFCGNSSDESMNKAMKEHIPFCKKENFPFYICGADDYIELGDNFKEKLKCK